MAAYSPPVKKEKFDTGGCSSDIKICNVCEARGEKTQAVYVCDNCAEHYCEKCRYKHLKVSIFSDHVLYQLDYVLQCKSHVNRPASYWCITCNKAMCTACVLYEHAEHEHRDRKKLTEELANIAENLKIELLNLRQNHTQHVDVLEEMLGQMGVDLAQMKREITEHRRVMIRDIRKKTKKLLSTLEQAYVSRYDKFKNEVQRENDTVRQIDRWEREHESLRQIDRWDLRSRRVFDHHNLIIELGDIIDKGKTLSAKKPALLATDF